MIEQPDVSLSSTLKEKIHSTHIDNENLRLANVAPMKQLWDATEVKEAVAETAILNRPTDLTEFSYLPISNLDLPPSILPLPNETAIMPSFIEPDSFTSGHTDSAESRHVSQSKIGFIGNITSVGIRHVHTSRGQIVHIGSS